MTIAKPLNVLFVFSDRLCGCTVKRTFEVAQALHQFQRPEINTRVIFFENLSENDFKENDILLFQRLGANQGVITQEFQQKLFLWIDRYKDTARYIYDIDDNILEAQNRFPISLMKVVHSALAPNEFLAEEIQRFQPRCHIIRTHIDLKSAEKAKSASFDPTKIHIGWFSTGAQGIDIVGAIHNYFSKKWEGKVLIHAYINQAFIHEIKNRFSTLVVPHLQVSLREMYSIEKGMDILINPIQLSADAAIHLKKDTEEKKLNFINSKSEIKYLHAGAAKKPLVVTSIPAYCHAISHGETGFVAKTIDDWISHLDMLVEHPEERKRIGENAYRHVSTTYTYSQVAEHYAQFFRDLIQNT